MIPDSVGWTFMGVVVVIILVSWWLAQKRAGGRLRGIPIRPISSLRDGEVVRVQGMLRYIAGPPWSPRSASASASAIRCARLPGRMTPLCC